MSDHKKHRFLSGNFAPVARTTALQPCKFTGEIPKDLIGGQYVRNGGNPVVNGDITRRAHWFDGDGMLAGVYFRPSEDTDVQPEFVNQYALTDVYLAAISDQTLQEPMNPSIALFLDPKAPAGSLLKKLWQSLRFVTGAKLGGKRRRISVANTGVIYHDGRALATCEIGPPLRFALPGLQTVGWFDGVSAEGERDHASLPNGFGGEGYFRLFREFTTGHPHVDPVTQELIVFHSIYIPPYVGYSVVPPARMSANPPLLNVPVPDITSPKLMHDFGVSRDHTIIIDLPILFKPTNLIQEQPVINYNPEGKTNFGVFPRHNPERIRWYQTEPCLIFHTVNTWDTSSTRHGRDRGHSETVNMLCCRMTGPSMLFGTADIEVPPQSVNYEGNPQCRLYFYQFDLDHAWNLISHQWALTAIGYEFPHIPSHLEMAPTKYVYGCSTREGCFNTALGKGLKIDCLVKIDAETLITRGLKNPPDQITGCVDTRSISEILAENDPSDPITVFTMPYGWYAQECSFVPRRDGVREDDGWLLSFVFDESQLDNDGEAPQDSRSELWIFDAMHMKHVVARIFLPQRVPYGIHGNWFTERELQSQRPVEKYREAHSHRRSEDVSAPNARGVVG